MTTGQRNERMARGDATTSWRDKTTRGRRNEGTTRDNATTSWHAETTPGRRDERRHNLEVVRLQTDSVGKVAAMDSSYRVYTRTIVCWRQIAASQRCGGPKWTDNFETSQGYASQNGTPLCQGVRMPQQILASKASKSSPAMRTFPSSRRSISALTIMLVKMVLMMMCGCQNSCSETFSPAK
jgi:hypothetical protein